MIVNQAVTVTVGGTLFVVEKIPAVGYQILRLRGLEVQDIWQAESFDGLSETMDFLTDQESEDFMWYDVFESIE